MHLKITVLGSGTSTGVPVIGCSCAVCTSTDPRNQRLRSSIVIQVHQDTPASSTPTETIVIDTTPDFRTQMLKYGISRLSKVLYTHTHADHLHGFDDLRAFSFWQDQPVQCYLKEWDLQELKHRFSYAFRDTGYKGAQPKADLIAITETPFELSEDLVVEPLFLPHGHATSTGFRLGTFAYVTDFKSFINGVFTAKLLRWRNKITTMIASGVHNRPHPTHSSIPETLMMFDYLNVKRGIITHISHEIDHHQQSTQLPTARELAYDGMTLEVPL